MTSVMPRKVPDPTPLPSLNCDDYTHDADKPVIKVISEGRQKLARDNTYVDEITLVTLHYDDGTIEERELCKVRVSLL
jgi:hypothetical protein